MPNSYFTNVGSYMQPTDPNELARLSPAFQNIGAQQANQNAAVQQANQLAQQAAQTGQQSGGMNPMAMAAMLRKGKPDQNAVNAKDAQMGGLSTYNPITQYGVSQQYGTDPFSESSRMIAAQERGFR
jgi:uncharacterized protein involved in copper resistance